MLLKHHVWQQHLTPRQAEVLELIANGKEVSEIAKELFVTQQTVKYHMSEIYRRLNARNRVQVARWWWINVECSSAIVLEAA